MGNAESAYLDNTKVELKKSVAELDRDLTKLEAEEAKLRDQMAKTDDDEQLYRFAVPLAAMMRQRDELIAAKNDMISLKYKVDESAVSATLTKTYARVGTNLKQVARIRSRQTTATGAMDLASAKDQVDILTRELGRNDSHLSKAEKDALKKKYDPKLLVKQIHDARALKYSVPIRTHVVGTFEDEDAEYEETTVAAPMPVRPVSSRGV